MDHHGAGGGFSFNSLVPEVLEPDCEFVVQEEWTQYTAALEAGTDACLLVGMHAMAGTPDGVINHTVSGRAWQNVWFNDVLVGETGINAAFCGTWGCPVVLVTGDEATCREARALLGDTLHTVTVKWGITARAARNLTPRRARELIEAGAQEALAARDGARPYDPGRPCEIRVEFTGTDGVEQYRNRTGVEVLDPRTIVSRGDEWWTAWRQFFF